VILFSCYFDLLNIKFCFKFAEYSVRDGGLHYITSCQCSNCDDVTDYEQ